MNVEDFSHGFDVLLDSYNTQASISLNEYEKSVFLTDSQEFLVLGLYKGDSGSTRGFEHTEEMRRYLSTLIKEANLSPIENSTGILGVDSKSKFFTLPDNIWLITYEAVRLSGEECEALKTQEVYPVRQDEYHKIRKNPFRGANARRALRLDLSDNVIEIISNSQIASYYVRYLRKLKPIVLEDFTGEISINGVSQKTECELPETLHQRILEGAVMMALRAKGINLENNENR